MGTPTKVELAPGHYHAEQQHQTANCLQESCPEIVRSFGKLLGREGLNTNAEVVIKKQVRTFPNE